MGTWNATPFGNDTAMDWMSELTSHVDGSGFLVSTLAQIESSDFPDAPEAEEALAAAAVVAAAATDPIGGIVADIKGWISTSGFAPDPDVLDCALRALAAIRNKSELRDLWDESGELNADFGDRDRSFRLIVTDQSGQLCWGGIVDLSVTMGRS